MSDLLSPPPNPPPPNIVRDLVRQLKEASETMNRPLLLQLLADHKSILSCIPLPPPAPVTGAQAIKDLLRERLVLNGVNFLGQGSLFLETLRRLTAKLCARPDVVGLWPSSPPVPSVSSSSSSSTSSSAPSASGPAGSSSDPVAGDFVSDAILARCARTTSGADSYYTVSSLLGNPEKMLLKPREGTSGGPAGGDASGLPPIDIEVFVSGGAVHCAVSSTNCYGFYRFEDIESFGDRNSGADHAQQHGNSGYYLSTNERGKESSRDANASSGREQQQHKGGVAGGGGGGLINGEGDELLPGGAWLYLDTVVVEKIDFRTGRSLRFLRVEIPQMLEQMHERETIRDRTTSSHINKH